MKTAIHTIWLCSLLLAACGREDVNLSDFVTPGAIRPNEIVLRPETRLLSADDKSDILGINQQGILVRAGSPMLDSIRVGSVLVNTATDPGDSIAYFRRVTEIISLANNIALRTEDVNLPDAYSRYVLDSRSGQMIIRRSNYFPVLLEFEPELLDEWVAVKAGLIPDVTGEISFDADSTYFTAQYDESGTIPFRLDMRIQDLRFDLTGVVTFKGEISAGIDTPFLAKPYPVIPIGETGLTLYALPKMEAMMKVEGQIVSPTIKITSGPHNFSMSYDESRAEPFQYDIRANIVPKVRQTADWSAAGSGSAELQVGAEVFLGITGFPNTAKAGFFLFGYATPEAARKGNFTDLQPRVTFDAEAGIGGKAFAELNFFDEFNGVLESPDIKFPITKWHLAALNTCTRYNDVDMYADNVNTQNELYLDVNCPGCTGSGFYVWVNDQPIDNLRVFAYGQTATITLPPGLQLLNTIAIQDEGSPGCYLSDVFLDPSLFNANCTQFTDSRDGNTYCAVQIGTQTWMGENLRYSNGGQLGHWYLNQAMADTLLFGRLYTFGEVLAGEEANALGKNRRIRGICPAGWHLPSQADWQTLQAAVGTPSRAGRELKLPNAAVWPSANLPTSSLFNAVSAGEYYPWYENRNGSVSGNRFKKTAFWTSNRGQFPDGSTPPVIMELDQTDYFDLGSAADIPGIGSIEQIGYSCRCVEDE